MTLLLIILLVVLVVLALAGGPTYMGRVGSRRRVVETIYEDDPLVEEEIIDEPVADLRPRRRVRRRL
jgi:flagellar basal body-associated protein FliL